MDKSPEEIINETMAKNLHTILYDDNQLVRLRKHWGALIESKVDNRNKNSFSFGVGDSNPETKKNQISLKLISKNSTQIELLQKNLSSLDANPDFPLIAVKIYTSKAEEVKAFAEQMIEMFGVEAIFETLPVKPELRFIAASDHLIVEVSARKSMEMSFMSFLVRSFLSKLPEHDIEVDLLVQLGVNFHDLINNHSENTVKDVMNGLKVNFDFINNLKGFFEEMMKFYFSKSVSDQSPHKFRNCINMKGLSFVLGGLSLEGSLNLNMGANEATLMSKIPPINIFDKNGILSTTPISQAKSMMDSNEMVAPVLELLESMEGKAEVYLVSPLIGFSGEIDVSGLLELAMHVINLYSESE
jgi:hypothetical protein